MIGILTPLLITTSPLNPNTMIQEYRNWEAEQNRTSPEEVLNSALIMEEDKHGCYGSTESEELLQFPSGEDQPSGGWRHDRRDDRPRVQPDQEGTGENCRCGHAREEDKEFRREGVGD